MRDSGDEIDLEILTYSAAVQRITDRVVAHLGEVDGPMKILEAGCGRRWEIRLEPKDYHLTGVDLDAHALDHRLSEVPQRKWTRFMRRAAVLEPTITRSGWD